MLTYRQISRFLSSLRLRKARALALYLLLEPGRKRRNGLVVDLFWRNVPEQKALASLRQTVRHLRSVSEQDLRLPILTGGGSIVMDLPRDWDMLDDIIQGLQPGAGFASAAQLARGFVEDLDLLVGISETFDGWLSLMRERSLTRLRTALETRLSDAEGDDLIAVADFLSEIDPCNEIAARFAMHHHWARGAPSRAIEIYNRLYAALDDSFDQEPETPTMDLLAAIKLDPDGGRQSQLPSETPQRVTLAVQGIANPDLDKRDASFHAVLVSDLRSRLSRFREWQVIDSEPVRQDFLAIRLKLLVIDASSRLVVEVIRPGRRELLWSEVIEDPHKGWADKVRMLVLNIGNALRVVIADRGGKDTRAQLYDRWLQSLALKGTWSHGDEVKAVALLRGITQEAPDFGPAHAELAGIYNIRHVLRPGTFQQERLRDLALSHALDAVAADAMDTRAHRVLAWCYCHKSEFDLAEFHFEQSLLLNPQNAHTIASCALGFAFCDNLPRAREMIADLSRLPEAMEPFHLIYLAAAHFLTGDYAACVVQCQAGEGLMSTVGGWHSAALARLGSRQAAKQRLDRYCGEIADLWCGEDDPTPDNVIAWYVSCFPLRNEMVRDDLRATLQEVLSGG